MNNKAVVLKDWETARYLEQAETACTCGPILTQKGVMKTDLETLLKTIWDLGRSWAKEDDLQVDDPLLDEYIMENVMVIHNVFKKSKGIYLSPLELHRTLKFGIEFLLGWIDIQPDEEWTWEKIEERRSCKKAPLYP